MTVGYARASQDAAKVEDARLPQDAAAALALNNSAVPAVNGLDEPSFLRIVSMGRLRIVRGTGIDGALLSMPSGRPYDSLNYQWFQERFDRFLYIDRVIVAEAARGRGLGRLLYEDTLDIAEALGFSRVCSEVNVDPPNPVSRAFHENLGFTAVHERFNPAEGKTVAMMVREIDVVPPVL